MPKHKRGVLYKESKPKAWECSVRVCFPRAHIIMQKVIKTAMGAIEIKARTFKALQRASEEAAVVLQGVGGSTQRHQKPGIEDIDRI